MDATVQTVRVDMGASCRAAVEPQLPGVANLHDRFHIPAHLNDAAAKVHRQENAVLKEKGDAPAISGVIAMKAAPAAFSKNDWGGFPLAP